MADLNCHKFCVHLDNKKRKQPFSELVFDLVRTTDTIILSIQFITPLGPNEGVHMADQKAEVKAVVNLKKNRLNMTISGYIGTKDLDKLYTEIRFCVPDLKKGFEVVCDISQCNLIYITGLPIYKKIIDFLISHNVGEIVRVVKSSHVSCHQIKNFTERIDCYCSMYAKSQTEAEDKLENLVKRDGIRFHLNGMVVKYSFNNETREANLVDISTSGCAVNSCTVSLVAGAVIEIIFSFDQQEKLPAVFQIQAEVVRTTVNAFAVKFLKLSDEHKEQLYQQLVREVSLTDTGEFRGAHQY